MVAGEAVAKGHWCQKCQFLEDSKEIAVHTKPHLQGMSPTTYCAGCGCKTSIHIAVNVVRAD